MVGESRLKCRVLLVVAFTLWVGIMGMLGFHRVVSNGCIMTYMYPTYIPVPPPSDMSVTKYGLFLYHEGWRKIDFDLQLVKLSGVPVLFIPGNGGSYKQVRSLAAESDRAFNGGPMDESFYQEAFLSIEEADYELDGFGEVVVNREVNIKDYLLDAKAERQYPNHLDWFAVDLDGEHSAMDGRILEEHTEYVVQAIHRILDRYKVSLEARSKEGTDIGQSLPTSVILVGHSMGGFVARAAVVHPMLRQGAVQTVLTLSSPHLSPPVAMQPSLGHFFSRVNRVWRRGYEHKRARLASISDAAVDLSHVVVVSIAGGSRDHQVRSSMASLDGIVPPSHGLTFGAPGMLNVWLAMEHQSILWCNQLVVQVSHTLLKIIDKKTGQEVLSRPKRLAIFIANLRSALPQTFDWIHAEIPFQLSALQRVKKSSLLSRTEGDQAFGATKNHDGQFACPKLAMWSDESHEKDLYIETPVVTVLAMDGRRRWLDVKKLGSNGSDHFVLVTNLLPCTGVRIHLWSERGKLTTTGEQSVNDRLVEVTRKMVQLPAGPAPRQIEPGGQTEQASPSGLLHLTPKELHNFRFITISVAPRLTISGRPPPAASMAVGQFFRPSDGSRIVSPWWLLSSAYKQKELVFHENHPIVLNLSISVSMGVLPLDVDVKTLGCGIKDSVFVNQQAGDTGHASLCKLRCFPPVALIWDPLSGLSVIPNFFSETVTVDSSPALWDAQHASGETTILFMMDPHCSYKVNMAISLSSAVTRFQLVHGLQIAGFTVAILLFVLMQQARAWELDQAVPSVLACTEYTLMFPLPFLVLTAIPLAIYSVLGFLASQATPSFISFVLVSLACYGFASGVVALLAIGTQVVFYATAALQVFLKTRWQIGEGRLHMPSLCSHLNRLSDCKVVLIVKCRSIFIVAFVATILVFFLHPALGLLILLLAHTWGCHSALCSCLAACFRSHLQQKGAIQSSKQSGEAQMVPTRVDRNHEVSRREVISFGDTQREIFNYHHGLLLLHLIATLMLFPSVVAWGQRLGVDQTSPWFFDSALCFGIILHGLFASKADINLPIFPLPRILGQSHDSGLSVIYAVAGLYCYLAGLALAPYRAFYALAVIGLMTTMFRILDRKGTAKGDFNAKRYHFHRH